VLEVDQCCLKDPVVRVYTLGKEQSSETRNLREGQKLDFFSGKAAGER